MALKTCLIIRTLPLARQTAQAVKELGFEPIILPAAFLQATQSAISIAGIQALLITSPNAPSLANISPEILGIPTYAVGDKTAKACEEMGFRDVISAGGDAAALAVMVADRLAPKNGGLLHLRGNEVAGDVKGLLSACGFEVRSVTVYETKENPDFKTQLGHIMRENSGTVLIHSPKGAARFKDALQDCNLQNWKAVAISKAAAIPLENLGFAEIIIAQMPNENSLFAALQTK